ncbi:hypothetical protein BP5796_00921 [Coleophoma crateriformis]|uniref:Uncharacterized protein n=1 Tax=Coleophoma crateriformis TaxID=565419 RepID=A0A3D8TBL8_9HELO|nr:hypothetical protein BP5796_00921 [Coleophoma crateriformis]
MSLIPFSLLHEKVSKKISLKVSKSEGQLFVGILCPEKHPSRCDSTDFFWTKVKAKHSVKQIADVYYERTGVRVSLSDGDNVLSNKKRLHELNHFQDDLVVLWAREITREPSSSGQDDAKRDSTVDASTAKSPSPGESEVMSSPIKRRLLSPSEPGSKRRKAQSVPLIEGEHSGMSTKPADISSRRAFSSGPENCSLQSLPSSPVQGETCVGLDAQNNGAPLSPLPPNNDTLPISPPATISTPDFIDELSCNGEEVEESESNEAANSNPPKATISPKVKGLKNTDIRQWMPRSLESKSWAS